jgi:D-lactate dehydrogenase (cytochrome)
MSIQILDVTKDHADYLHDESRREGQAEKICFPISAEEVRQALLIAAENSWSVTLQGGRTGITGGCVPEGGLILNLSRMNTISAIESDRMTVQPGALLSDVRAAIKKSGLFFPSDLTETTASIGGMVSCNASGARSFFYGAVRNWIQALEVVLANGDIVHVERGVHTADGYSVKVGNVAGTLPNLKVPDVKSAAGYFIRPDMDLVDLFIGAEGTLGVVTAITIQLLPEPKEVNGLTAFFLSEQEALGFVRFLRDTVSGSRPADGSSEPNPEVWLPLAGALVAIEFFDSNSLDLLRRMKYENPAFAELPELKPTFHTSIYFEFDGEVPEIVVEKAGGAVDCWFAAGEREIEALKTFRHAIPESVNMLIGERKKTVPGLTKLGTDMSVPDGELEHVMRMYHDGLAEAGLDYVIFGHIGNNHVHVNILPRTMEEYEAGKALYLEWARQVVAMGGSVSAEHGIGKIKTPFLQMMYGEEGIRAMRSVKHLFDPTGLLNPGNLFCLP